MAFVDVRCASCGHESLVDPLVAARMKTCPACGADLPPFTGIDAPAAEVVSGNRNPGPPVGEDAGETPPPERPRWRLLSRRQESADKAAPPTEHSDAKAANDTAGAAPSDTGSASDSSRRADAEEPRLRLDRAGGGRPMYCTSCGVVMLPGEKICTMCGYNTETNRFVQQEHARRELIRRSLATVAVVLVLGVGGWLAARRGTLPHPRQWPRFFVSRSPQAPPSEAAAASSAPRPRTQEEIAELAAAFENTVRRELDDRYPTVVPGVPVELVRNNGLVITGVFRGLTHRGGALLDVERVLQEIPLDDLRPASRVQVDPAYREERIRAEAWRRAETGQAE